MQRRTEQTEAPRPYSGLDCQPIAGAWRHGRSGGLNRDHDPFTGAVIIEIPQADRDDMEAAYTAAAKAQSEWASRLPSERADAFVERLAEEAGALKTGNPDESDTLIGPLINQTQLDGLTQRLERARGCGARQVIGGEPEGLVLPPHVFADVTHDMELAREELFGPVAPVIRAQGEDDALRIANDTGFGLSSCVFTADIERGTRFAQRLQTGMAHVNDQPVNDLPNNPFGGEKNSGIGRFGGGWAVEAFTTDQWVTVQHEPRHFPRDARRIQGPWAGG